MKLCFNSLRVATTGAFALIGAVAALTCSAQSVAFTSNVIPTLDTDWATGNVLTTSAAGVTPVTTYTVPSLTVPQFNGTLGTLKTVQLTLNWNTYQAMSVQNIGTESATYYGFDDTSVSVTLPNGNAPLTGAPPEMDLGSEGANALGTLVPNAMLPVGNTVVSAPTSPFTDSGTTSVTLSDPTDLTTFTYSGTATYNSSTDVVNLSASTSSAETASNTSGNVSFSITTQAGASVTVTYTYGPSTPTNTGCIQGVVINNTSGDGYCHHVTETGLGAGIKINVYTTSGTLVGSTTTAADGSYEVTGLLPNTTYIVIVVVSSLPNGYTLSCQNNCLSANVPATGCVTCVSFTAVQCNTGCQYNSFCQSDWSCTESCNDYNSCLKNCYCIVYPEGNCTIGGSTGSCTLTSCGAIENCLVHGGNNCPLPKGCQTNPKSYCNLGTLCGETLACKLNCDFSNAGIFCSGFKNLTCQSGQFRGCTVSQVLNAANCYLNGQSNLPNVPRCSANDLCTCLQQINSCFSSSCGNGGGNGFCK